MPRTAWTCVSDVTEDSYIDSREVLDTIEELTNRRDDDEQTDPLDDDEKALLAALVELDEEARGYCDDWQHGAGLIRDDVFEDYARELAEDCGYIDRRANNPLLDCIDWSRWAEAVQQDYTELVIGGTSYWVR